MPSRLYTRGTNKGYELRFVILSNSEECGGKPIWKPYWGDHWEPEFCNAWCRKTFQDHLLSQCRKVFPLDLQNLVPVLTSRLTKDSNGNVPPRAWKYATSKLRSSWVGMFSTSILGNLGLLFGSSEIICFGVGAVSSRRWLADYSIRVQLRCSVLGQ